jgi:zona occludens toxin (predicted ATPase)
MQLKEDWGFQIRNEVKNSMIMFIYNIIATVHIGKSKEQTSSNLWIFSASYLAENRKVTYTHTRHHHHNHSKLMIGKSVSKMKNFVVRAQEKSSA